MIVTAEEVARAVWTYPTRTLLVGTAAAPTNRAERVAKNIWEYYLRTLTVVEAGGGASEGFGARPSMDNKDVRDLMDIITVLSRFV